MKKSYFHSIRDKITLILLLEFSVVLIMLILVMNTVMMSSINDLENKEIAGKVNTALKAFNAEYGELSQTAYDWGTWDDSYYYVQNQNKEYEDLNLYDETFMNLRANALVYLNKEGEVVFAEGMDLKGMSRMPVSNALLEYLQKSPITKNKETESIVSGIVSLPEGPMIIAVSPIVKSNKTGPVAGHFIVGRYLNDEKIALISDSLNIKIKLDALDFEEVTAKRPISREAKIGIDKDDKKTIIGSIMIKGIDERPVAWLSVQEPRSIHFIGKTGINTTVFVLLIVNLGGIFMGIFLLHKFVIRRLMKLSKGISNIRKNGIFTLLENDNCRDEISNITTEINQMLEKLEFSSIELAKSEKKYRRIVEHGNDVIYRIDNDGYLTYISPNAFKVLGIDSAVAEEKQFLSFVHPQDHQIFNTVLNEASESKSSIEFRMNAKDGGTRWFSTNISRMLDENSIHDGYMGVLFDVHDRRTAEEDLQEANENLERIISERTEELVVVNEALLIEKDRIKHIAYHDHLTGLPNGLYFKDFLNRAIERSKRAEKPMAIMFIDLDGFKMINDSLGHSAGDDLLVAVSQRLKMILRKSDFISRIGGDEFNILLEKIDDADLVDIVANKILASMDVPFVINGQECFISASIGIALYPADGQDSETLIKNSDLAMYKAKENGKSQYCFCTEKMKKQVIENMTLSNQLWRALERDEFEVYYQPQVNCNTSEIVGMEALLRWNHPTLGMVMPGKFIALAEQTGAIINIGEWVLNTACRQTKIWQDNYYEELRIAVNVSVKQLQNRNIVQQVEKILKDTGIAPMRLELEITESIVMREIEYVIEMLNDLKNLGVDIAIDDFGTEYASMSYLKLLPVDRIKIAMPFVQGIDVSEKDEAITKALIILAKNMGMGVIAEGVETRSQLEFLTQKLCDETQGYYFYKPMPASAMEELLKQKTKKNEF